MILISRSKKKINHKYHIQLLEVSCSPLIIELFMEWTREKGHRSSLEWTTEEICIRGITVDGGSLYCRFSAGRWQAKIGLRASLENSCSRADSQRICQCLQNPRSEFTLVSWGRILGRNPDKSLKGFSFTIHSLLYSFALIFLFLQTHATSYIFFQTHATSNYFYAKLLC